MSSEKMRGRELLTIYESIMYELVEGYKDEDGNTLGNKDLAEIFDMPRGQVSKLRNSMVRKLGLKKGF